MLKRKSTIINQQVKKFFISTAFISTAVNISIIMDSIIVGNLLGQDELVAINLVTPMVLIFNTFYNLLGAGGANLFSIALGEQNQKKAKEYFTVSTITIITIGMLIGIVGFATTPTLARILFKESESIITLVSEYMSTLLLTSPIFIMVSYSAYFARAESMVKLSSAVVVIANAVNVIMDIVYIVVFKTGIKGAGLATGTGYLVGLIILILGLRKSENLRFCKITTKFFQTLFEIVKMGVPNALFSVLGFLTIFSMNKLLMIFMGKIGIISYAVCIAIEGITTMFTAGIAQTIAPLLGVLYGEEDYEGITFTLKSALKITTISTFLVFVGLQFIPVQIAKLFGITDPKNIAVIVRALSIYPLFLPLRGILLVFMQTYQINNHKKLSNMIVVLESFAIVVPLAWFLCKIGYVEYIWFAFVFGEIITLFILWINIKVIQKKNPGKKGFFLMETDNKPQSLDITMIQKEEHAVQLSEQALSFCFENKIPKSVANKVGVVLEEMAMNAILNKQAQKTNRYIDVCLVLNRDEIRIIFKDNGRPFNPLKEGEDKTEYSNLQVALAIANEIQYDYVIGMNRVIIKIQRAKKAC